MPYDSMTVAQIAALPVANLPERDAHLYLWTTSRLLDAAFDVMSAWGFKFSTTLVWAKNPIGGVSAVATAWPLSLFFSAAEDNCRPSRALAGTGGTGNGRMTREASRGIRPNRQSSTSSSSE
jgi:hypothetical protein